MLIKYENLNQILRRITFLVAIGALTTCVCANAFPIEPLDMDFVGPTEREEMAQKDEDNKYEKVKERIDDGTATQEDHDFRNEYLENHYSADHDRASSGNNEGTFSTEKSGYERDS